MILSTFQFACRDSCGFAPLELKGFAPLPILKTKTLVHWTMLHPRHDYFKDYLYYCVKQYSELGHCDLTANLCSRNDWELWRDAVDGQAGWAPMTVFSLSCICLNGFP